MLPPIGYALREENRKVLAHPLINAVEILFERADNPLDCEPYLGDLSFDYCSVHALKLSPCSPQPPAREYLDALRALAKENGAAAISDHLGFTRDADDGLEIGHFSLPPFSQAALDITCHNVELIQRHFQPTPFYLENIAYLFQFQGEMSEAEFLIHILERTGCGWLLDVTNLYANARNFGQYEAESFLRSVMPAAERVQLHLAGGYFDSEMGLYVDSHSNPVPDDVWELYRCALQLGMEKVDAILIERDADFSTADWMGENASARRIASEVQAERRIA
jgi:uncharacterized protein